MSRLNAILSIGLILLWGCGTGPSNEELAPASTSPISVKAAEFTEGGAIPTKNTADGGNQPPSISWTNVPSETQSIAMIVDDSDANGFTHWLVYNLPGLATHWGPEASLATAGENDAGDIGYYGPKPPPGKPHHYHFRVYALQIMLPLGPGASKNDALKAMAGHVLAQGELVGVYETK